jgi:glutamate-1-semialdehyde 2,1-aminomutase
MFLPDQWPTYFKSAKGAEVVDLDGKTHLDMSYIYYGIGAKILGFADPDVNAAVKSAIDRGSMSTLNCDEDIELAERLIELHPGGGHGPFRSRRRRSDGDPNRAATGHDMVAFCRYHGWHNWYLSTNLGATTALDGHLLPGPRYQGRAARARRA